MDLSILQYDEMPIYPSVKPCFRLAKIVYFLHGFVP